MGRASAVIAPPGMLRMGFMPNRRRALPATALSP